MQVTTYSEEKDEGAKERMDEPHACESRYRSILQEYGDNVASELGRSIGVFTSGKNAGTVARVDTKELVDFEIVQDKEEAKQHIFAHKVVYGKVCLAAVPRGKILCEKDLLTKEVKYTMTLENAQHGILPEPIGPYTLPELVDAMQDLPLAWRAGNYFEERIRQMIAAYHAEGQIEYKEEIKTGGFYWLDGKIITSPKTELSLPTKMQVRQACFFITDVQKRFYPKAKDTPRFSHLLNLAAVAPFDFARKQMNAIQRYGYIQSLDKFGASRTGKSSTVRRFVLELWRKNDRYHFVESGSTTTPARIAGALSETDTFPVLLDEMDYLVHYRDKNIVQEIISMLKNARESEYIRIIRGKGKHKQGAYRQFALSLAIITRNSVSIDEEGFNSRYVSDEYKDDDVVSPEMEKAFNDYMDLNISSYAYAGDFIANYIVSHPEVLNQRWDDIGRRVWHEAFDYAGIEYPNWLGQTMDNATNANLGEERRAIIRATFNELINDAWRFHRHDPDVQNELRRNYPFDSNASTTLSPVQRFVALATCKLLSDFTLTIKGRVIIHPSVKDKLKKRGLDGLSQGRIASLCKFAFKNQRVDGESRKVVNASIEEFEKFLAPVISEPNSQEDTVGEVERDMVEGTESTSSPAAGRNNLSETEDKEAKKEAAPRADATIQECIVQQAQESERTTTSRGNFYSSRGFSLGQEMWRSANGDGCLCPYCGEEYMDPSEYERHVVSRHEKELCYPRWGIEIKG